MEKTTRQLTIDKQTIGKLTIGQFYTWKIEQLTVDNQTIRQFKIGQLKETIDNNAQCLMADGQQKMRNEQQTIHSQTNDNCTIDNWKTANWTIDKGTIAN